jgi:hypothetical protein
MFGHRDPVAALPVIELSVRKEGGGPEAQLSLSARHFIPVASNDTEPAVSAYAQDVQPGDVVTVVADGKPSFGTVVTKRRVLQHGAFNPYTTVSLLPAGYALLANVCVALPGMHVRGAAGLLMPIHDWSPFPGFWMC